MALRERQHGFWRHLRFVTHAVLGLNRRNSSYIFSLNPPELLPMVDEKVVTKGYLVQHQIPHPETYGVVHSRAELKQIATMVHGRDAFVVKPSRGSGGNGIVVCEQPQPGIYLRSGGLSWTLPLLERHVDEILSGVFALDERADEALFEYRIHLDQRLTPLAPSGIPDIRFLVVLGVPILAMLRLPTKKSGGRANLHAGGVGVGIDLTQGRTRRGMMRNFHIRRHPDTRVNLTGFPLPYWQEMLMIAARCYEAVPLGYLGVDLVLDEFHGPMVLELNARPGLQIQLANEIGLRPFLEAVLAHRPATLPAADRIALGQEIYRTAWPQFVEE